MVGRCCCVPGCKSTRIEYPWITFSPFPKLESLRNEWIRIITANAPESLRLSQRRPWCTPRMKNKLGSKNQTVCGFHFDKDGKRKYTQRVPNIFSNHNETESDVLWQVWDSEIDVGCEEVIESFSMDKNEKIYECIELRQNDVTLEGSRVIVSNENEHDYCLPHNYDALVTIIKSYQTKMFNLQAIASEVYKIKEINQILLKENVTLKRAISKVKKQLKTTNQMKAKNESLKVALDSTKEANFNYQTKVEKLKYLLKESRRFSLKKASANDTMLNFYTGFQSVEEFNDLFEYIEPDLNTLNIYNGARAFKRKYDRNQHNVRGRPMELSFREQLFLILCRLKVGLLEEDLAYRFCVSQSTVSNICITWFDLLEKRLSKLRIWPSRDVVNKYMPEEFKEKFSKTRVIIDATELFIQKPDDFKTQSDTWSSYKTHNTAKGLIGCTPNGFISFVSDLVPGRMSDRELTIDCGLIDLIEAGDSVMADRGFLIEDSLKEKGAVLNMPPFLGNKAQLSGDEVSYTREIASVRIHIERVIRSVKKFHLLNTLFPNSMHNQLNKVWKICCYLINFCNEPLLNVNKQTSSILK